MLNNKPYTIFMFLFKNTEEYFIYSNFHVFKLQVLYVLKVIYTQEITTTMATQNIFINSNILVLLCSPYIPLPLIFKQL